MSAKFPLSTYEHFYDEIKGRYWQLREEILTKENIKASFENFNDKIQNCVKEFETKVWKNVPNQQTNNIQQIIDFAENRIAVFDNCFGEKK